MDGSRAGAHQSEPSLREVTETVRSLIELMRANGLSKLDVTAGSVTIRLRASKVAGPAAAPLAEATVASLPSLPQEPEGHVITAPMIGTFYATPAPGEPPFVNVGDRIEAGQTIGIIEAMKIMNEIPADRSGVVVEIMVANAEPVEYGTPLMRLLPDGGGT